ncbi:response regulator transcription factor [Teredinibacter franksiae]|jgi:Response regulator containing a CheY-like receiver domain and an HTH DNA-binding domain|uniref:response regulator transcription factor n=1 Tax=Teredinibacter franksiae TaxID=2761453 RepID=UPI001628273E|nr:response regulator transcription factor [Teredinibacter franksiae]
MKTPIFISSSSQHLPSWKEAFPGSSFFCGLPPRFDNFDESLIFVDYSNLQNDEKHAWLESCVATGRKVFVLSRTPNLIEAIEVIKAGAVGYGHTLSAPSRMREMMLVVSHGGLWVGNKLLKRVMAALSQKPWPNTEQKKTGVERYAGILSQREITVGQWVAQGATNAEISAAINIKERTVKAHITSIFSKLNVRNRVELALLLNNIQVSRPSIQNSSNRPAL